MLVRTFTNNKFNQLFVTKNRIKMATVKVKFRASSIQTKEGTLYYEVNHNRITQQIHTRYKIYPAEWNADKSKIKISHDTNEKRQDYLISVKEALDKDLYRLKKIIKKIKYSKHSYSCEDIVNLFISFKENYGFLDFTKKLINQLKQIGKKRTAETYTTTLNSFTRFRKEQDISIMDIDSFLMIKYEIYLKTSGICPNTSSFYMRNLRAIYNRAVDNELTVQRYPFKHVYTGIDKTVKRAVSLNTIRQIKNIDLTSNPSMDYARDLFMFSFYTRGMSFIDMAF